MATTTNGEINVSAGARSALRRAQSVLDGYRLEDPRIDALHRKLGAIASPEDGGEDDTTLAKAMLTCERIAKSAVSAETRELAQKASRDLAVEHLARMSPAAHAAWVSAQRLAGFDAA